MTCQYTRYHENGKSAIDLKHVFMLGQGQILQVDIYGMLNKNYHENEKSAIDNRIINAYTEADPITLGLYDMPKYNLSLTAYLTRANK